MLYFTLIALKKKNVMEKFKASLGCETILQILNIFQRFVHCLNKSVVRLEAYKDVITPLSHAISEGAAKTHNSRMSTSQM